ncbi:MAG: FAD-binding protein [Candidatus Bathyarchaeota archaeon]|nr:FAD-binding protein [Candidatus Bathyarchaeota archaeon]
MAEIKLNKNKCNKCKICVDACPFGCVILDDQYPRFVDCRFCGICVTRCPTNAITIFKKEEVSADLTSYKGIMIFAEQRHGKISPVVYELIGKGAELAKKLGEPLKAVFLGNEIMDEAEELIRYGVEEVYLYQNPKLEVFKDDSYSQIISDLVQEVKPSIVLMGATSIGRSLAPRISAILRTGLTADCTGLEIDEDGNLIQIRPAFGGNVMAKILCTNNRPQMATVRYKVMKKAELKPSSKGNVKEMVFDIGNIINRTEVIDFKKMDSRVSIVEADIIVSGGKGLGGPDGFESLRELASLLGGGVGASRSAVDEGWIDYSHQVGLSGRTVRPKIYIACGISGSVQHLAGMQTSETIIAINNDPNAPIFKVATYGIVGDLYEVIPELIKKIKTARKV